MDKLRKYKKLTPDKDEAIDLRNRVVEMCLKNMPTKENLLLKLCSIDVCIAARVGDRNLAGSLFNAAKSLFNLSLVRLDSTFVIVSSIITVYCSLLQIV